MKVFKFGGASVGSVERIRKLPGILYNFDSEKLLIVVSAMGKTTNALEKVAEAYYAKQDFYQWLLRWRREAGKAAVQE